MTVKNRKCLLWLRGYRPVWDGGVEDIATVVRGLRGNAIHAFVVHTEDGGHTGTLWMQTSVNTTIVALMWVLIWAAMLLFGWR